MTKTQFSKLEEEYGFNSALEELRDEERHIIGLEALLEIMADEIADCVNTGEFAKAQSYLNRLQDYDGVQYWYFNRRELQLPEPIESYSDIVFLLTDD